jgi:hypothetical protein
MTNSRPNPGATVLPSELPDGLLEGLPIQDQYAISEIISEPVRLNEYDDAGRAELEFTDREGILHIIYVRPDLITRS